MSLGDLIAGARESRQYKAERDAWSSSCLHPADDGFIEHAVYGAAEQFLAAWQTGNYGKMAGLQARNSTDYDQNIGKAAGDVRDQYELVELEGFELLELDFVAASICVVNARLTTDGATEPAWLRWIHEDNHGAPIIDGGAGAWKVMSWGPLAFFNEPESPDE